MQNGISGCGRNCPDDNGKDIAFIGTSQGFMLAVGGNTGMRPEAGKILTRKLTVEQSKSCRYLSRLVCRNMASPVSVWETIRTPR